MFDDKCTYLRKPFQSDRGERLTFKRELWYTADESFVKVGRLTCSPSSESRTSTPGLFAGEELVEPGARPRDGFVADVGLHSLLVADAQERLGGRKAQLPIRRVE